MTHDQPPLFDTPAPQPKFRRPRKEPDGPRYAAFKPKHRTLCDDCCLDIHQRGQGVAPLPRRAVWKRADAAGTVLLCQHHKDERQNDET